MLTEKIAEFGMMTRELSGHLQKIFSLIDLTSLNDTDTDNTISILCKKAVTPLGHVAAVCIYPQFVKHARACLGSAKIKIAAVANFPQGTTSLKQTQISIQQAIKNGADEMDVVFPYQDYLAGNREQAGDFIRACKKTCGSVTLKVILETGALKDPAIIAAAANDVLLAGADFIKTSTGKIAMGATLEAATAMLLTIKKLTPIMGKPLRFKVSGGVRTIEQAMQYIALAESMMGKKWVTPPTFRIGASQLVDELMKQEVK